MAIGKQLGAFGSDWFLERRESRGCPTGSTTVTINVATDSPSRAKPPPPPKEPWKGQTYSTDPSPGIGHYVGDEERKGKDNKDTILRGKEPKGKEPTGKEPKRKRFRRERLEVGRSQGKKRFGQRRGYGGKKMSLVKEEMMQSPIFLRIRHGGRIAHRWALGMNVSIENTAARGEIGSIQMENGAKCEVRRMQKSMSSMEARRQ